MSDDIESLQGTWSVAELETDGQRVGTAGLAGARIAPSKKLR